MSNLRRDIDDACDMIDAAICNGDWFIGNPAAVMEMREYMARWEYRLKEAEEIAKEQP